MQIRDSHRRGCPRSPRATTWRALIADAALAAGGPGLLDGDILVVTSKVVSKAEGRVVAMSAAMTRSRRRPSGWWPGAAPTTIAQTRHGFVMAAAGVDESNTAPGTVVLLPEDPDESARRLRKALRARLGVTVGVVVTDTMGRPWRAGQTDTAIGAAGVLPVRDHRGERDTFGNTLEVTVAAVADEIAAASDLVKGRRCRCRRRLCAGFPASSPKPTGRARRALVRPRPRTCSGSARRTCCPPGAPFARLPAAGRRGRRRAGDLRRADRSRPAPQRAVAVCDRRV